MKCFEVVLGINTQGKDVGRVVRQVEARTPLAAAIRAESELDAVYGAASYTHTKCVRKISRNEYNECMAQAAA